MDWTIHSRREVLKQGKFLRVEYHDVELPDGHRIPEWSWVITPDFINVVLIDDEGAFILFRQGKYAYEGLSLAPVGGYIEPGEDPLEAAKREVLEETGYAADLWISLGQFVVDANRGCGIGHSFLAMQARKVAEAAADDLEPQELLRLSRPQIEAALFGGEIKVLPWASLFALSLLYLDRQA